MAKLSLKKNFTWALVANIVSSFCMWLLLVILIKVGTDEVVGVFAVAKAFCLPISMLLTMRLQIVQVTDAQDDYCFGHYYTLRLVSVFLAVCLSIVAGFLCYSPRTAVAIGVLSIGYAVINIRDIFLAVLQKSERMDQIAVSRFILGPLSLFFFGVIFFTTQNLVLAIIGLITARLIILLCRDVPTTRACLATNDKSGNFIKFQLLWEKEKLWSLAKITIPLGLVGWFSTLLVSVPRLVLYKYFGMAEVGYFAAMSSLLVAGSMVIVALGQAVGPRLSKYYAENNIRAYNHLLFKLLGIGVAIGLTGIAISWLFGELILALLFKPHYAEYNDIFIWITIAGAVLFVFNFLNWGLCAVREFRIQVPIYGLAAAICIGFSFWLIPVYGMKGAVWSIIAGYIWGTSGCAVFVIRSIKKKKNLQKPVKRLQDKI